MTLSQTLLHNGSYTFPYFVLILGIIKMKFGQVLVYLITNISNMFLAQCCRRETSSRIFYFNEMRIWQDVSIFSSCYLLFLILLYSCFTKNEKLEIWQNWLLSNWSRFLNWKGPDRALSTHCVDLRFSERIEFLWLYAKTQRASASSFRSLFSFCIDFLHSWWLLKDWVSKLDLRLSFDLQ